MTEKMALPSVHSLQETELSQFIEKQLAKVIRKKREETAKQLNMLFEDTEYPSDLAVRVMINEVIPSQRFHYRKVRLNGGSSFNGITKI